MSSVEAFYSRLAQDEVFRNQVQNATSKEECRQIVKAAGYDFTQDELEAHNTKILATDELHSLQIQELGEKEMAAVLGGFHGGKIMQIYGSPDLRQSFIIYIFNGSEEEKQEIMIPTEGI
jgi:predicted ribosomally synthesized peptide with nif11-like leader